MSGAGKGYRGRGILLDEGRRRRTEGLFSIPSCRLRGGESRGGQVSRQSCADSHTVCLVRRLGRGAPSQTCRCDWLASWVKLYEYHYLHDHVIFMQSFKGSARLPERCGLERAQREVWRLWLPSTWPGPARLAACYVRPGREAPVFWQPGWRGGQAAGRLTAFRGPSPPPCPAPARPASLCYSTPDYTRHPTRRRPRPITVLREITISAYL